MDGLCIRSMGLDLSIEGDGRTVVGMLAPYNEVAEVDDGFGPYFESFVPGCFDRIIKARAQFLRVQLEHNGAWVGRGQTWLNGPDGLSAEMRLDDTEQGRAAAFKIRDNQTPGLSLAFLPAYERPQMVDGRKVVRRSRIKAIHHVALCPEGAYSSAQVAAVRSAPTERTYERLSYWQDWTKRIERR